MVLTTEHINYLIYLYLKENNFEHAAFCFGNEANILKTEVSPSCQVPPGALIKIIQKGIQYVECELAVAGHGTWNFDVNDFSLLDAAQPESFIHHIMGSGKDGHPALASDDDVKDVDMKELAERTKVSQGPEPYQIALEKATFLKGHESEGLCPK